MFYGHLDK